MHNPAPKSRYSVADMGAYFLAFGPDGATLLQDYQGTVISCNVPVGTEHYRGMRNAIAARGPSQEPPGC